MKEKVKKVIIQDDTSPYVFLIVAMFCTILFIMLVIHHNFDLLEAEVVTFIPMTIFWNEFIKTLKKHKNGLYYFILSKENIMFSNYNNDIEEKTNIKLSDILEFKLNILHREKKIDTSMLSKGSSPCDIKINIKVVTNMNEVFEFQYEEQETKNFCINDIFAVAKKIPNFSYTIDSNNDIFMSGLNARLQDEKISLSKQVKHVLDDPNVSNSSKSSINILLGIMFFLIWLIGMLIIKIIIDIVG